MYCKIATCLLGFQGCCTYMYMYLHMAGIYCVSVLDLSIVVQHKNYTTTRWACSLIPNYVPQPTEGVFLIIILYTCVIFLCRSMEEQDWALTQYFTVLFLFSSKVISAKEIVEVFDPDYMYLMLIILLCCRQW